MKQVIVVDASLALPSGKLAAQVAHAAVAAFLEARDKDRRAWLEDGMPKVVLRSDTGAMLTELATQATALGLPTALIHDAGRTVVAEGTMTCLGIGPGEDATIDRVTGALKLLR